MMSCPQWSHQTGTSTYTVTNLWPASLRSDSLVRASPLIWHSSMCSATSSSTPSSSSSSSSSSSVRLRRLLLRLLDCERHRRISDITIPSSSLPLPWLLPASGENLWYVLNSSSDVPSTTKYCLCELDELVERVRRQFGPLEHFSVSVALLFAIFSTSSSRAISRRTAARPKQSISNYRRGAKLICYRRQSMPLAKQHQLDITYGIY